MKRNPKSETNRRGSALLVTVGALAIVSVFAAVYISIGQTDRRLAEGVEAQQEVAIVESTVSRYLAQVIAQDRFDTFVERADTNAQGNQLRRENTDYPYTDFTRQSVIPNYNPSRNVDQARRFQPNGTHGFPNDPNVSDANNDPDAAFRVADDPWLASTTPSYVSFSADNDANDLRYGRLYSRLAADRLGFQQSTFHYLDNRDWWQISNFAPDGRFVNLYSMRDPAGGGPPNGDGFDAAPGINSPSDAPNLNGPEMSVFLSLLRARQGAQGRIEATLDLPFGMGVNAILPNNFNSPLNTPAWFTMYQKHMLMPDDASFQIFDRFGALAGPDSPDFPDYQYADTDGDGLYDARWFELVDATHPDPRQAVSLLPQNETRWFVAARAMDLSALVNVNTATDSLTSSSGAVPPGDSPAEVDLRRLLTAEDESLEYLPEQGHPGLGVNGNIGNATLSISFIEQPDRLQRDADVNEVIAADYTEFGTFANAFQNVTSVQILGGRFGYDALRRSIAGPTLLNTPSQGAFTVGESRLSGTNLPGNLNLGTASIRLSDFSPFEWGLNATNNNQGVREFRSSLAQQNTGVGQQPPAKNPELESIERRNYYRAVATAPDVTSPLPGVQLTTPSGLGGAANTPVIGTNLFGDGDLLELLTYHGVNDDSNLSRLEQVLSGRVGPLNNAANLSLNNSGIALRFSPLRSNRPTRLERGGHDNQNDSTNYDRLNKVADNVLDNESMALLTLDRRRLLTTRSGASPIQSRSLTVVNNIVEDPELTAGDQRTVLAGMFFNPSTAFNHYANALMPGIRRVDVNNQILQDWQAGSNGYDSMYYGHRGPALPHRIAAHAAVNLVDMQDGDSEPTVATLIADTLINNTGQRFDRGNVSNAPQTAQQAREEPFANAFRQLTGFDIEPEDVSGVQASPLLTVQPNDRDKIANVYGIEAHPVITEASIIAVYADAPANEEVSMTEQPLNRATVEAQLALLPGMPTLAQFLSNPQGYTSIYNVNNAAHINLDLTSANNELLFYAFAVQLYNPFAETITINALQNDTGAATGAPPIQRYDYYIEFNGRFFPVANFRQFIPDGMGGEIPVAAVPQNASPNWALADDPMTTGSVGTNESQVEPVINIAPGTSQVVYFLAHEDAGNLNGIWSNFAADYGITLTAGTNPLEILRNNFIGPTAARTAMFNPRTMEVIDDDGFEDVLSTPAALTPAVRPDFVSLNASQTEVRLWRTITDQQFDNQNANEERFATSVNDDAAQNNWVTNDQLVDRLEIKGAGFGELAQSGEFPVLNTAVFDDSTDQVLWPAGSGGTSLISFYTVRRKTSNDPADPLFGNPLDATTRVGVIPPYLLQTSGGVSNENSPPGHVTSKQLFDSALSLGDFPAVDASGGLLNLNFNALLGSIAQPTATPTLSEEPWAKHGTRVESGGLAYQDINAPFVTLDGTNLLDLNALFALPNDGFGLDSAGVSNARVTDLLLAFGAGPAMVMNSLGGNPRDMNAVEWTTTSEALTAALGLEQAAFYQDVSASRVPFYADLVDAITDPANPVPLLDNGRLHLDRFVPFFDLNNDAGFDTRTGELVYSPVNPGQPQGDLALYPPLPAAMRVLDNVDGLDIDRGIAVGAATEFNAPLQPGRININTAPLSVLRTLPGLSPSVLSSVSGQAEYWQGRALNTDAFTGDLGTHLTEFGVRLPVPLTHTENTTPTATQNPFATRPDIAATLQAYRDRQNAQIRAVSRPNATGMDYRPDTAVTAAPQNLRTLLESNFRDRRQNTFNLYQTYTGFATGLGREEISGIRGLNPTPGFTSTAEVLAASAMSEARFADLQTDLGITDNSGAIEASRHLSMDYLGRDVSGTDPLVVSQANNGQALAAANPVVTNSVTPVTAIPTRVGDVMGTSLPVLDDVPNDISEKLGLASGILNAIDVRSDIYAVWFKLRGYRRSDVEGLNRTDLMTPSIERRYVMVIDRSTVTEPGQAPEVLFLQEVPN